VELRVFFAELRETKKILTRSITKKFARSNTKKTDVSSKWNKKTLSRLF